MVTPSKRMKNKHNQGAVTANPQPEKTGYEPRPYFEGDLDLIQIAISAQNVQLKIDDIEFLILNGLRKFLNLSSLTIFRVEDEQDLTFNVKVMTEGPHWSSEYTTRLEPGLLVQCFKTSQPILALNTPENLIYNFENDSFPGSLPQMVRGFPLISNEQKLGILAVIDQKSAQLNVFQERSLLFLTQVLANAIYHDQLIQQFRIANADLEANRWDLLRSRNTLRALFDSIPSSIYIINKEYDLVAINTSRAGRVNNKPKNLVGRKCFSILFGRDAPCHGCLASETLLHGNNTNRTLRGWILPDKPIDWDITTY
ncbi:MAG TPA: GAF domain-containing protein, partial [Leptolinea sp.]